MKRFALIVAAGLGLLLSDGVAHAWFGAAGYSGYQPCWNPCAIGKRRCKTPEERRLEHFWHDYYDSLRRYYKGLEHIDWVAYYKNHGYQINSCAGGSCGAAPYGGGYGPYGYGCGAPPCQRINYAPVVVSPQLQWAVPGPCAAGPACLPGSN
jgi:hypothetical protein